MALNKVIIMGRITKDIEVKQTQNGNLVTSFTVAVDRAVKQGQEKQTDFISCVAWNKTAEFVGKYFGKGRMIAVTGSLKTRTYDDKNGTKHYLTEVWAESVDFTGEPRPQNNGAYGGGQGQGYNNAYSQPNAPQNAAQPAYGQGYGAPPAQQGQDFQAFEVFSDDGVPF